MKKVLIWIGCFLLTILIDAILHPFGVRLGYGLRYVVCVPLALYLCKQLDIRTVKKEAATKGVSIWQLVTSIVPKSLVDFCESNKGKSSVIKGAIKTFMKENSEDEHPIPKRYLVVLREMYK